MGIPQNPSPPHLYPQALQLKLYQAFIFSIPILFSIILFLLFYLFYLKRRASTLSAASPQVVSTRIGPARPFVIYEMGFKGDLKGKLPTILFDEEVRARDSQCCVCLGDFEMKEELHQIPSCKHVFHIGCIRHWLQSNSTCPLCRCSIVPATKHALPDLPSQENETSNQQLVGVSLIHSGLSREEHTIQIEGSSSATACLREPENETGHPDQEPVILHIQSHA